MPRRQPLPRLWMMTDERQGDALFAALARLPEGAGIVFRHYSLEPERRRRLFDRVRDVARDKEQMLLLAGSADEASAWGADGSHGRGPGEGWRSAPVHDLEQMRAAEAHGAELLFLSPVFPTRSHPGAVPLGVERFGDLAAQTKLPVIALGGMNAELFAQLDDAYGWAAIDAWSSD